MTGNEQPMVKTIGLTKRFGDFVALDALDLHLNQGQILGFIGPNGAGKTTTIRILVGLSKPTGGQAFVNGVDCTRDTRKLKQLVGFMPDTFGAYDNMRVREYLDFFGAAFKIPRAQRIHRVDEVMELTGSTYMKDRFVDALSHGMKQRVGVARTLLHDPPLLILDEPANGLDPNARIEMREMLLRLAAMGKTIIVTSHILPELSRICDTVAIITQGKLRAFGTLEQIMRSISQRRIIEVQMTDTAETARMADLLKRTLDDQADVRASPQEAMVRFSTEADDDSLAQLLGIAVGEGLKVAQFHEVPLDLEDAFLEVTGLGKRGQGPAD
ncbi:MAG: ABC transporter ATP-binding protein [Phycisphaeraceae bacterium]